MRRRDGATWARHARAYVVRRFAKDKILRSYDALIEVHGILMGKMPPMKKFLRYWLPPLLLMALVFPVGNKALGSSRSYETLRRRLPLGLPARSCQHGLDTAYIVFRKIRPLRRLWAPGLPLLSGLPGAAAGRAGRRGGAPGRGGLAPPTASSTSSSRRSSRTASGARSTGPWTARASWPSSPCGPGGDTARPGAFRSGRPGALPQAAVRHRPFGFWRARLAPALAHHRLGRLARGPRPPLLRPGARRAERPDLQGPQVPVDGQGRGVEKRPGPGVAGDPRVTRVGRVLRATAMDELPQLFNIFKGDMSFVGPRALRPNELEVNGGGAPLPLAEDPGLCGASLPSGRG